MNKVGLVKRVKFTGDLYNELLKMGYPPDTASSFCDAIPDADCPKVIRCKECQYYTPEGKRCDHPQLDYNVECYDHWLEMEPNDFCSCGERKISNDR